MMNWLLATGILIIVLAIVAIARQWDVRLVLFTSALAMGGLVGQADAIVRKFLATFADEKFLVPIGTAMGFSYVLRRTGCDQHLVRLLVQPLVKVRFLLVPGTILVGFFVNMPVVSQTSTAVAIGPVVIPILRAANVPPLTIGGAILLGCSIGGELFNPGAPELQTTITGSVDAAARLGLPTDIYTPDHAIMRLKPLNFLGLAVAMIVFAWWSRRNPGVSALEAETAMDNAPADLRVNYLKAMVPLLPLVLLYLTAPGIGIIDVPRAWLGEPFATRLVGTAMLLGVAAAVLTTPKEIAHAAEGFFQGAGYGFTHIISLIVAANCFGEGLKLIGLAEAIGSHLSDNTNLILPLAGIMSLGFAFLSGSGMATAQSLFGFFAEPALAAGIDPVHVGAVVSLAAAAGRTMSPVAAVTLMTAQLTGTKPLELVRQVGPPLIVSTAAIIVASLWYPPA